MKRPIDALVIASFAWTSVSSAADAVTPKSGSVCTPIRITGSVADNALNYQVLFNGQRSLDTRVSFWKFGRVITAYVPQGATSGPLVVANFAFPSSGPVIFPVPLGNFTVKPSGSEPTISNFTSDKSVIESGTSTILRWTIAGTNNKTVLRGGTYPPLSFVTTITSIAVSPTNTTYYELDAGRACLSTSARLTVQVLPKISLTLSPNTSSASRGSPLHVMANIPEKLSNVKLSCASLTDVCSGSIPAGQTSGDLTVVPFGFGTYSIAVTATEEGAPGESASANLTITTSRTGGDFAAMNFAITGTPVPAPISGCTASATAAKVASISCVSPPGNKVLTFKGNPPTPSGIALSTKGDTVAVASSIGTSTLFTSYMLPVQLVKGGTTTSASNGNAGMYASPDGDLALFANDVIPFPSGGKCLQEYRLVDLRTGLPFTSMGASGTFNGEISATLESVGNSWQVKINRGKNGAISCDSQTFPSPVTIPVP